MMFDILFQGLVLGQSYFDTGGDPPMGVAYGAMIPSSAFDGFQANVRPTIEDTPDVKIWTGLTARTESGQDLRCIAVSLAWHLMHPHRELEVTVLGLMDPPYSELFPVHCRTYADQFGSP